MKIDTSRVLTFVLAGGKGQRLEPLTKFVPKPAIPFGGIYRIIDFTLSNCLNSGLKKIFILTQYESSILARHIRDGWQGYFVTGLGEFIETLSPQYKLPSDSKYEGTADAVFQNLSFIREENFPDVLVLAGDHIYKMDYRHLITFHKEQGADLTIGAVEVPIEEGTKFGVLEVDEKNKVRGFVEKPSTPIPISSNPRFCLASMGIYVFSSSALFSALSSDAKDSSSSHDFGKDIIPKMLGQNKIFAFNFIDENKKEAKYWRDVGTLDAYFEANMDLVSVSPFLNLYDAYWPIRTSPVQEPPPKFVFASEDRQGVALDSMISPGVIISGGRVVLSVLSPRVRIHSFSQIERAILFEAVDVGRYAKIKNAIIGKNVHIPEEMEIGYDKEEDKKRGFVLSSKNVVVVPEGTKLP